MLSSPTATPPIWTSSLSQPSEAAISLEAGGCSVTLTVIAGRDKREITSDRPGERLFLMARRAGIRIPTSCERGECGTCMVLLRDGSVTMVANEVLTDEDLADGYVLACQSIAQTPAVTIEVEQ